MEPPPGPVVSTEPPISGTAVPSGYSVFICVSSSIAGGATGSRGGAGRASDRRLKMNQRFRKESRFIASVMAQRPPDAAQTSPNICEDAGKPSAPNSVGVSSSRPAVAIMVWR